LRLILTCLQPTHGVLLKEGTVDVISLTADSRRHHRLTAATVSTSEPPGKSAMGRPTKPTIYLVLSLAALSVWWPRVVVKMLFL
jgi:hypothetical protein